MTPLWPRAWRRSPPTSPQLIALLRAVAADEAGIRVGALDEGVVRWAVTSGMGPLLRRAAAGDPEAETSPLWSLLQGADLTARVVAAHQMEAMTEILDACTGEGPPPVLLKGISICEQHYPEPHLRPMRDLDVLVDAEAVPAVERILHRLGYRPRSHQPPAFYAGHHHGCPFVHPDTGVWVEVHRALFSQRSDLGGDRMFSAGNVQQHLRSSVFRQRLVRRLGDEFQIVYLACHWANRLRLAGGMVAIVDVAYLLKDSAALDWDAILRWTEGSITSRHVTLLLTYLDRHQIVRVPPEVVRTLALRHSGFGRVQREAAHALLDRYVVNGRHFGKVMSEENFHRLWPLLVRPRRRRGRSPQAPGGRLLAPLSVESRVAAAAPAAGTALAATAGNGPVQTREEKGMKLKTDAVSTIPRRHDDLAAFEEDEGSTNGYPKRRPDLRARPVGGETVVLDRRRQLVHQLNETATYIWDRCDGHHSVGDIASGLAQIFEVEPAKAESDVVAVVRRLETVGLLERPRRRGREDAGCPKSDLR